jgi:hypothetical protein
MISDELYEQLVGKAHQPKSIVQFFWESPLVGVELNLLVTYAETLGMNPQLKTVRRPVGVAVAR